MKKPILFVYTVIIILLASAAAWAAPPDRFLDTAPEAHDGVRLAVFYPSTGSIKALAALFKNGLLDPAGLTVVGVYHEKEATDYAEAAKYAADNGLGWMKFHAVAAAIGPEALYRKNECTPEYEAVIKKTDGVIFFGGPDIPPAVYGKKTSLLAEIEDPYRHYFELSAVFHFLGGAQDGSHKPLLDARPRFPILGICLGFQTLNVGSGGTMVQDIWQEVYGKNSIEDILELGPARWHNNPWPRLRPDLKLIRYNLHALRLSADGPFVRDWGFAAAATPVIVSSHHQALDRIGKGFKVIATSPDGRIPEAVIHQAFPNVLGIQFHPEFPLLWDPNFRGRFTPDDKEATSLLAVLEQKPPSLAFNKKIWSWLGAKLRESRGGK
ncbi:MAG: gamma-glutamyl-gamma-aminobutyrate hydrolase family protein [Candidatus Aminicenantes bacterium]|nr:gamma-glutamyl-gamma-aminobutyrate hydrolase family protein [Candidatus Aminicenantes bacterium]